MARLPALRERHRAERRRLIVDAAAEVFATRGLAAASIADIARAAGVSPAAIYTYVSSREELLFAATLAEIDELEGRMRAVVDEAAPADAVLRAMVEAYAGFCRDRPEGFRMLVAGLERAARAKAPGEVVREYDRRAFACVGLLHAVVARGIDDGTFKPADPWETAHAVWGAFHGILSVATAQGTERFVGYEVSGLVARVTDLLLEGLKA